MYRPGRPIDAEALSAMGARLAHRGPDETGSFIDGPIGLGVHRLRVIDLATGHQPVTDESGSVVVAFNGEIYNYRELRRELQAAGHRFTGASDTEVIAHLYEAEGERAWSRLNGIFAIAVWDARRRQLWLVRDRLGVKPLYYHAQPGRVLFASELKPILQALGAQAEVNLDALGDYFALNYVGGPKTILQGVRQVPAGHWLRCDEQGTALDAYWRVSFAPRTWPDQQACEQELLDRAKTAVGRQMVSDVPLGALLSGGVDSSLIVALMASQSSQPIRTFCVRFAEDTYDESPFARQVSQRYGTEHTEVTCDASDCLPLVPKLAYYADNLFADPSLLPTYLVCQVARRQVTVALSGDGGDELFAGYSTYQADRLAAWYRRVPAWIRRGTDAALLSLPPTSSKLGISYRARKFAEGAHLPPERAHAWWRTVFTPEDIAQLAHPDLAARLRGYDPFAPFMASVAHAAAWREPLDRHQSVDLDTWLVDDILVKLDRMSMANSLEARVPWLDHELVEFACAIPARWRMRGLATKALFKRAAARVLPREIVFRRKAGFLPALSSWFRGPWKTMLHDVLSAASVRRVGWLHPPAVQRLLEQHARGADCGFKLWNLVMLVEWHRTFRDVLTHPATAACAR